MIVNEPGTHAEVTAAFQRYEQALMDNDLEGLDALFWQSERTVRYGVGENLYGIEAIRAFRRRRIGGSPPRVLRQTIITTYGTDFATANTEFLRAGSALVGRQSQAWARMPDGWRIVSAHVSTMAGYD